MTTPSPMNRILAAFSQGRGEAVQDKKLSLEEEEKRKQLELQEKAQQQHAKQFDAQYDLQLKNHELLAAKEKAEKAVRDFQFKTQIGDQIRSGAIKPGNYSDKKMAEILSGGNTSPDELRIGDQKFNTSEFGSAEEVAKNRGTAKMLEMRPLFEMEIGGKKDLLGTEYSHKSDLEKIQGANALNLYTKRAEHEDALQAKKQEGAETVAKIRGGYQVDAANIRANAKKDDGVSEGIALLGTGEIALDDLPIKERGKAVSAATNHGIGFYRKAEEAAGSDISNGINQLNSIAQFVKDLSTKAPAEGKLQSAVRRGKFSNRYSGGELAAHYHDTVSPAAAAFGRQMGEKGAFTERDRAVYNEALPHPSKTDMENKLGINRIYGLAYEKLMAKFPSIKKEARPEFIKKKFGIVSPTEFKMQHFPELSKIVEMKNGDLVNEETLEVVGKKGK